MTAQTISQAVEKKPDTPRAMIATYRDSFAAVLPSHIDRPDSWIRLAQAALKRGKMLDNGQTELEAAAANNPATFLSTLLDCARLGLEPGTEQYYLTPRRVKVNGSYRTEILGIIGYQGIVELMYRAGAVSSVIAECVYDKDVFEYAPGRHPRPIHEINWDLPDRGHLRLVYAYAVMKDGATSKVVVLNQHDINRIKAKSQGADSKYSPWNTDEPAMWLKSAVRQLRKWVPTSAEYIREQMRAARDVAGEDSDREGFAPALPGDVTVDGEPVDFIDADSYEYAEGEEPFDEEPPPEYVEGGEPW